MSGIVLRLRLLILLALFLFDLSSYYIAHIRALLWSGVFLLLILLGMLHSVYYAQAQVASQTLSSVASPDSSTTRPEYFTREKVTERRNELIQLLELQPQHRDILINLSFLDKAVYDQKSAQIYWDAARKLDPNHPLFANKTTVE